VRIAVIDSSCLINLAHLSLATRLSLFFQEIYVPSSVQKEVGRKSRFRYRLKRLYRSGLFRKCAAADKVRIDLLLNELDQGEAEALAQAQEKMAGFFIGDEKRARQISENMGVKAVGTARLLARLHLEGYAGEPRELVEKLRKDLNCYLSNEVVEEAVARASETI